MAVHHDRIALSSRGDAEVVDITGQVREAASRAGIQDGLVSVFVPGSTGALTTIEFEPGCVRDLRELFDRLIPENPAYHHHEAWNDGNGHSHLRAALLGPSLTVPLVSGELRLGTWQQIVFVDFDNRSRDRELWVTLYGE